MKFLLILLFGGLSLGAESPNKLPPPIITQCGLCNRAITHQLSLWLKLKYCPQGDGNFQECSLLIQAYSCPQGHSGFEEIMTILEAPETVEQRLKLGQIRVP